MSPSNAKSLFKDGKRLYREKDYANARKNFEESRKYYEKLINDVKAVKDTTGSNICGSILHAAEYAIVSAVISAVSSRTAGVNVGVARTYSGYGTLNQTKAAIIHSLTVMKDTCTTKMNDCEKQMKKKK